MDWKSLNWDAIGAYTGASESDWMSLPEHIRLDSLRYHACHSAHRMDCDYGARRWLAEVPADCDRVVLWGVSSIRYIPRMMLIRLRDGSGESLEWIPVECPPDPGALRFGICNYDQPPYSVWESSRPLDIVGEAMTMAEVSS